MPYIYLRLSHIFQGYTCYNIFNPLNLLNLWPVEDGKRQTGPCCCVVQKGRSDWRVFGCNVSVMPSDANLFNLLKGNHIMKVINVNSFLKFNPLALLVVPPLAENHRYFGKDMDFCLA